MASFQGMSSSRSSSWNIVQIIDTFEFERYMPLGFQKGQISSSSLSDLILLF